MQTEKMEIAYPPGDKWFIDLVNERSRQAESDRKSGKKFLTLRELQKEYQRG